VNGLSVILAVPTIAENSSLTSNPFITIQLTGQQDPTVNLTNTLQGGAILDTDENTGNFIGGAGASSTFTGVYLLLKNLVIRTPQNPAITAINANLVGGLHLENVIVDVLGEGALYSSVPSNSNRRHRAGSRQRQSVAVRESERSRTLCPKRSWTRLREVKSTMPRSCTVCLHPERKAIDEALFRNKTPFRNVSKQYGVTASALFRHKQHSPIAERVRKVAEQMEKLPPRKAAYIRGRLDGKSKKQAALDAGFSETMAEHAADKIETANVREAFGLLVREMIPPEFIAKVIAEGMAATETKFFSQEGVVKDQREVPAWSERRQYAELAAEYGGYYKPAKGDQGQGGGGVILILPGQPQPQIQAAPINGTVIDAVSSGSRPIFSLPEHERDFQSLLEEEENDG